MIRQPGDNRGAGPRTGRMGGVASHRIGRARPGTLRVGVDRRIETIVLGGRKEHPPHSARRAARGPGFRYPNRPGQYSLQDSVSWTCAEFGGGG